MTSHWRIRTGIAAAAIWTVLPGGLPAVLQPPSGSPSETSSAARAQTAPGLTHTLYNTPLPQVIRVAIRAGNNPRGPILWVQTVGFQQYCEDVLPNEWIPSWDPAALQAGAMAIKMFAWYHVLHPVSIGGFQFDVDNTVNFQQYKPLSAMPQTTQAVQSVWPYAYVFANGGIVPLDYRAGTSNSPNWPFIASQKMSQWGSQYWAAQGYSYQQILNLYYTNRVLLAAP